MAQNTKQEPQKGNSSKFEFALQKENYILLAIGFAIIIIGFLLMMGGKIDDPNTFFPNNDPNQVPAMFSFRRITLAPIVVVFGFIFEIYAIMKKPKENTAN
jgi:hypothetical protein